MDERVIGKEQWGRGMATRWTNERNREGIGKVEEEGTKKG